ncbi:MAG: LLM class flavin-dependent oxidoreductase [Ectothiorhodospiraceae bacterium]
MGEENPGMLYSIFSVQDHYPPAKYPDHDRDVPQLYEEIARQAELADTLGYDTFFVAEHHFHEYGAVPNPAVMLGHLAARTKNIRLGSAISILTFHNPLTVAESYAMVDVLSGGRLFMGVGSGYLKHEFEGYRVDGAEKRDRFDENLEIVTRLLAGERVSYHGQYSQVEEVKLNVQPVQKPLPPIAVAILRREAAYHVGRAGRNVVSVPYASVDRWDEIEGIVQDFRQGREEAGKPAGPGDAVFAFHTHVADSDTEARRVAEAPFDLYVDTRLYAKSQTYDDIMNSGLALFGSVDTVVDKMVQLYDWGIRHVMTLQNFGHMPEAHVHRSMRMFAEEVMPQVRKRIADRTTASTR